MSDLISRREAIKAIDDLPNCYNGFSDTYDKACIIGALEELPSAEQWIPVKWREPTEEESKYYTYMADCEMPEDGQEILVTDGKYVWKDECTYDDGFGLDSLEDWQNITAWMPLPEPYMRGEEK